MRPEDVEEVVSLDKVCFPGSWTKESYLRELSNPRCCYLVARQPSATSSGDLLAYAGMRVVGPEAHISTLCVAPEARRRGLATALLARLLSLARQQGASRAVLEVRETNASAQQLYRRFGFRPVGLQRTYYGDTAENALVMWKDLPPPPCPVGRALQRPPPAPGSKS
jgi:ribosomal-protein-alanine N-acetyltransferase